MNPVQSTGSVLGELIKDLDLPLLETLIETPQSLPTQQDLQQPQFNIVQAADGPQELQVNKIIPNITFRPRQFKKLSLIHI